MMMTADPVQKVLVLRSLETQGNFTFRMAVLPGDEARQLEERLSKREPAPTPDIGPKFGEPLTLSQVMDKLKARDFAVLDYPGRQ